MPKNRCRRSDVFLSRPMVGTFAWMEERFPREEQRSCQPSTNPWHAFRRRTYSRLTESRSAMLQSSGESRDVCLARHGHNSESNKHVVFDITHASEAQVRRGGIDLSAAFWLLATIVGPNSAHISVSLRR